MHNNYFNHLVNVIEQRCNIDNLFFKTRKRKYIDSRRIAFKILRDEGLTYTAIGDLFGLDHATILHSIKDFDFYINNMKWYKEDFDYIKSKMITPEVRKIQISDKITGLLKEYSMLCDEDSEDINNLIESCIQSLQEDIAKKEQEMLITF